MLGNGVKRSELVYTIEKLSIVIIYDNRIVCVLQARNGLNAFLFRFHVYFYKNCNSSREMSTFSTYGMSAFCGNK